MQVGKILALLIFTPWLTPATAEGGSSPQPASALYVLREAVPAGASTGAAGVVFREVKRDEESSLVQLEVNGGAKESSTLLMLEGFCGLMRERHHRSAVAEQTSVAPVQFRVTFPEDPKIDDKPGLPRLVFEDQQCSAIQRH